MKNPKTLKFTPCNLRRMYIMNGMSYMVRNSSLPNPIIFETEEEALECVEEFGGVIHAFRSDREDYYSSNMEDE